ncbi:MAG: 1-deoxy-D-xylulose-5-phosphate synthase [Bacilli bacterium]|nr:1-deoxy-D-xylulose-5-phosphate synthase [Bacilli bacterium]
MKEKLERIDINSIKDPSVVKTLGYKSLTILCHDIRNEIIKQMSVYGGHLASNLGVVEATVMLYKVFDFPKDKLIFDVGHQCYTSKILTGRSLERIRKKGGVSGFQRRAESEYDPYEAGHSSTSLSAAEAFAVARDKKKEKYDVVALIGDSSIVNGLAFEALNDIGAHNNKVIVVLNDNDMAISTPKGALGRFFRKISSARFYNKFKSGYRRLLYHTKPGRAIYNASLRLKNGIKRGLVPTTMFDNMGFTYIGPIDGHDLKALDKAYKRAKNTTKSTIVHIYTTKGKGYKYAEKDRCGYWHGVTPFNIETGEPKNLHPGYVSWPHKMGDLTFEALEKHDDTMLICPAMTKGSHLDACFEKYPTRCIDVGIAEEHALTFSGAISLNGYHPIVTIYSTFLQRAYDQLFHDCARLGIDMTLLIDRAGFVGSDGTTHQGLYDEAFLKSIPSVILTMPANYMVARDLYAKSLEKGHGVFAIRYPHELMKEPTIEEPLNLPFGRMRFLQKVDDAEESFVGVGQLGEEVMNELIVKGYKGNLVDPIYLNPLNKEDVKVLSTSKKIVVYDPYGTENGFAETLGMALLKEGFKGEFKILACPNEFVHHSSISEQRQERGLDKDSVLAFLGY